MKFLSIGAELKQGRAEINLIIIIIVVTDFSFDPIFPSCQAISPLVGALSQASLAVFVARKRP